MGILVKHSGNVAPLAVGAYGGGQGKRQAEDAARESEIAARKIEGGRQRAHAAQQADLQRKFQQAGALKQQKAHAQQRAEDWARQLKRDDLGEVRQQRRDQFGADQAKLSREFESERRRDERDEMRDFTSERDALRFQREKETALDEQMRRREDLEWGYTTKQRQEFDQLSEAYNEAVKSGDFTPEELTELRRQTVAQQGNFQVMPRLKKESPWPTGQDVGQTWKQDGYIVTREPTGQLKKLGEDRAVATQQDKLKRLELSIKMNTKTVEDDTNGTREEVDWDGAKKTLQQIGRVFDEDNETTGGTGGSGKPEPSPFEAVKADTEETDFEANAGKSVDAFSVKDNEVVMRTLKNGKRVMVRRLPKGGWELVNNVD